MKITEQKSKYSNLENKSINELVEIINLEDKIVAISVSAVKEKISEVISLIYQKLLIGGRLFYIGSGTSGRLGVLDASECPPTFGVSSDVIIGIIAGGDKALKYALENVEDQEYLGWNSLLEYKINSKDFVLGISASGSTPFVLNTLNMCKQNGISIAGLVSNENSEIKQITENIIEVITGPEVITGSTRMKAGTAHKMVLNMISSTIMIKLGHIKDSEMIDMQLNNKKLLDRGARMIVNQSNLNEFQAKELLKKYGSVRKALDSIN